MNVHESPSEILISSTTIHGVVSLSMIVKSALSIEIIPLTAPVIPPVKLSLGSSIISFVINHVTYPDNSPAEIVFVHHVPT